VGSENEIKMHDHIRELGRNIAVDEGSMSLRLGRPMTNQIDDLLEQSLCVSDSILQTFMFGFQN